MRMQRHARTLLAALFLASLAGATTAAGRAGAAAVGGQAASPGYHVITVAAKDTGFDPAVITVKKGEKVRLLITSAGCDRDFRLDAFDINQVLKKDATETIDFTAHKAGTFELKSSPSCGKGHRKIRGKLVVEE